MTVLSKQERLRQLATRLAGEDEYFLGLLRISLHQRDRDIIVTLLRDAAEAGAGTDSVGVRAKSGGERMKDRSDCPRYQRCEEGVAECHCLELDRAPITPDPAKVMEATHPMELHTKVTNFVL